MLGHNHSTPNTQGALRDPGLRSETPSALIRKLGQAAMLRRGLSLIEVVASTMIVGLMSVAALNSLGAATRSSESIGNRAVALGLADELMSEILQAPYKDPTQAPVFGLESGEPAGPRSAFDDVDDYDGWDQSPPQYRDGTVMPDRADWRHRVQVNFVAPGNTIQIAGSDQGAKRIRVTIQYRDQVLAEQIAVRTDTTE
jgi:prepilin-type N-terminal cleavage/methylation domain-containing protein